MSSSLRIGVDIDDVLYGWFERAHAACERAGITNGQTPSSWAPFNEYGCTEQQWLDVMCAATVDGSLYDGDPFPGVVEALRRLHQLGHTIHLVTARGFFQNGWLVREHTVRWLRRHEIPHDTLTFAKDKTIVSVDIFADDAAHNIDALSAVGVPCCLIDAPHNQDYPHPWRAETFAEFVEHIEIGYHQ